GESVILDDEDAFSNAREPLAQAYAPKDASGTPEAEKTFVTVSNHFKSKGSGEGPGNEDTGDGQGFSNADRVKQAKSLVDFAGEQQKAADSDYVYLLGDFNSYTQEDPMQVLYEAGYKDVGSEMTDKST
ncbi:endonuclease/exonuclease/phosphatase, partial [Geobacillus sp. MMMUD3]|nr:endonuclease/exonuclease/phosphatase [Geobacillus sp. MMMUD3]